MNPARLSLLVLLVSASLLSAQSPSAMQDAQAFILSHYLQKDHRSLPARVVDGKAVPKIEAYETWSITFTGCSAELRNQITSYKDDEGSKNATASRWTGTVVLPLKEIAFVDHEYSDTQIEIRLGQNLRERRSSEESAHGWKNFVMVDDFKKGEAYSVKVKLTDAASLVPMMNAWKTVAMACGQTNVQFVEPTRIAQAKAKQAQLDRAEAVKAYNKRDSASALSMANKAIDGDPKLPEPYYVKGMVLLTDATVDPKTQKMVAPRGCLEAFRKYLELAPNGDRTKEVKEILSAF